MVLVFSDEFNVEGRSFYPGDDPYWAGVDLHYWQTNNLEWYDPKQITTKNGSVEFKLERAQDRKSNHDMEYSGGMMATWNRVRLLSSVLNIAFADNAVVLFHWR
jgi:beta-glucanase (GH16 family)